MAVRITSRHTHLAMIGRFPSFPSPPTTTPRPYYYPITLARQPQSGYSDRARRSRVLRLLPTLLLRNYKATYSMTSYPLQKGLTTPKTIPNYGGTTTVVAFGRRWMLSDYYFMVKLLVTFTEKGSMDSCRKLIHSTTVTISTASRDIK